MKKSKFDAVKRNIALKAAAWAVCMAAACGAIFFSLGAAAANVTATAPNYEDSNAARDALYPYESQVAAAFYHPGEAELKQRVDDRVGWLDLQRENEIARIESLGSVNAETAEAAYQDGEYAESGDSVAASESAPGETAENTDALAQYRQERIAETNAKYDELTANAARYIEEQDAAARADALRRVEENADLRYAVVTPQGIESNMGEDPAAYYAAAKAKYAQAVGSWENGEAGSYSAVLDGPLTAPAAGENVINIYTAMTPGAYQAAAREYAADYQAFRAQVAGLVVCLALFVAAFVWLMASAGWRKGAEQPQVGKFDVVYLDLGFLIMLGAEILLALAAWAAAAGAYRVYENTGAWDALGVFGLCAVVAGGVSVLLLWAMSVSRRDKNGTAKEFTLFYKIFGGIKQAYDESHVKSKVVGAFVVYLISGLLIAAMIFASGNAVVFAVGLAAGAAYIALSLRYLLMRAAAIRRIEEGVAAIKNGDTGYAIPKSGYANLDNIAEGVNNIADGLSSAVQKEVRAERMKTELITNISHDLKTPLTSILTYVDLLKQEEGLPPDARKYVEVLDVKSSRLKVLTDDLFDAAKAQSGDMTVTLTRIELVEFMEQALGELSDRTEASGLVFITDMPAEKMYVVADGKLLFRVIGNLMDNVLKYALAGSRVYIGIQQSEDRVCVVVKNISRDELNITEDELMERFVRGDVSRNTEGSGLGLAIAKDFTRLMGGELVIEIDGDLFKVRVCLPRSV